MVKDPGFISTNDQPGGNLTPALDPPALFALPACAPIVAFGFNETLRWQLQNKAVTTSAIASSINERIKVFIIRTLPTSYAPEVCDPTPSLTLTVPRCKPGTGKM